MRLILIRHGETVENVNEIVQGQQNGTLTKKGKEQAKLLGKRLKEEKIDYIICSDLGRVKNTAKEIIKFHQKTPIEYSKEVRERAMGIFEGGKFEVVRDEIKKKGLTRFTHKPEKGENYSMVKKRAERFLKKIKKEFKGKTLLVCSHGAYNKVLLSIILGKKMEEVVENWEQKNTCVNIIEFDPKNTRKIEVKLINCTKHLEEKIN